MYKNDNEFKNLEYGEKSCQLLTHVQVIIGILVAMNSIIEFYEYSLDDNLNEGHLLPFEIVFVLETITFFLVMFSKSYIQDKKYNLSEILIAIALSILVLLFVYLSIDIINLFLNYPRSRRSDINLIHLGAIFFMIPDLYRSFRLL